MGTVSRARDLGVRNRSHSRPDFDLLVTLDSRLRRTAPFFTPGDSDLGARLAVFILNDTQ